VLNRLSDWNSLAAVPGALDKKPVIKFWGPEGTIAERPNKSILPLRQKSRFALVKVGLPPPNWVRTQTYSI